MSFGSRGGLPSDRPAEEEPVRKIVFHIQTTLDNRISDATGELWEPFPWGEAETAQLNEHFKRADTWVLARKLYEAIVPWWETVAAAATAPGGAALSAADHEFAALQHGLKKVVFSRTLQPADDRIVVSGDLAAELAAMKGQEGKDILLTCGPETLAPLAGTPGLIDEYLLAISPAVLADGPRVFEGLSADIGLELAEAKVFDGGCLLLRYRVLEAAARQRPRE
jgi:dihydrofolate reductase